MTFLAPIIQGTNAIPHADARDVPYVPRFLFGVEMPQLQLRSANDYFGTPLPTMERDADMPLVAPTVFEVLLMRNNPQIRARIVQAIPIDVVNHHALRRIENGSVQENAATQFVSEHVAIFSSLHIPAVSSEEREVAVINFYDCLVEREINFHGNNIEQNVSDGNRISTDFPRIATPSSADVLHSLPDSGKQRSQ